MARYFKNPESDQVEEVGDFQVLAIIFIPVLYLFFAGLWRHALIWIGLVTAASLIHPICAGVSLIGLYIFYVVRIRRIVAGEYLKKGWLEVPEPVKATRGQAEG